MKIDSSIIFKKAVAREEALRDFIDALDSVDNIQVKLTESLRSLQMLLSLYRGLDDESRSLLPKAVYEQCEALSIHTERIQACLIGCGGLSIEKLLLAIKES